MSMQSQNLRKRVRGLTKGLPAKDYLIFDHKVDEIQTMEPRGGGTELVLYWGVVNRQLKYTGNNFFVNLMSITPDFINRSFFYNQEPENFNDDDGYSHRYNWGDTYDIDADDRAEERLVKSMELDTN